MDELQCMCMYGRTMHNERGTLHILYEFIRGEEVSELGR